MNTLVIEVNNLSKKYILSPSQIKMGYTLKEHAMETVRNIFTQQKRHKTKDVWALQDISFHVTQGEILGIIGANGAGKSTLLRLLSNITKPTTGTIKTSKTITSLLQIGSGFHPDLTGRENIFFGGSILGVSKKIIEREFQHIVSFADVLDFIDVPIKYYSSGMNARLSFAMALFLQPEILIIDEALAVGDAEFQKKCIDFFSSLATSGVTIVITSHDMALIQRITTRCIYLDRGSIKKIGASHSVVRQYLADSHTTIDVNPVTTVQKKYDELFETNIHDWLLYHQKKIHFNQTYWMGVRTLKNPLDAWIYQEILYEVRPDIVLEIGSLHGGSTLYLAHILDCIGHGTVISVDKDRSHYTVTHPRICALTGDSTSSVIINQVKKLCANKTVCIILDSSNNSAHAVLKDMNLYSPLVTKGSYFIVEDGIIDLFKPGDGIGFTDNGPLYATTLFLTTHPEFIVDKTRERYMITYNPRGFLKRIQ